MSLWEFLACMDGWRSLNGVKPKSEGHTEEELAALGIEGF